MWTPPDETAVFAAMDATWPAAKRERLGGWVLRRGLNGGRRASSVWPIAEPGLPLAEAIAAAEARMRGWGQRPYFQISPADDALDAALAERDYVVDAPCPILAAPAAEVAAPGAGGRMVVRVRGTLALLDAFWAAGGIGPARRAVMARAAGPKETLVLREDDRVAAAAFVAIHGRIAMVSAVLVGAAFRRRGVGAATMAACAEWAVEAGADALALSVEEDNAPALALYRSLGMAPVSRYHYRAAPEKTA
jgi:ribosomal protein S18 acetylase RimI-like enzyme